MVSFHTVLLDSHVTLVAQRLFLASTDDNQVNYSESLCQKFAAKVTPEHPLPKECHVYPKVINQIKRRNSNKSDHAKAFAGMSPSEMAAAMAARERGNLHHAQIQRRLTTSHNRR